jgi:DNA helicase-4
LRQTWQASPLGRLFCSSPHWTLALDGEQYTLEVDGRGRSGTVLQLEKLDVKSGLIWSSLHLEGAGTELRLSGIGNGKARRLRDAIAASLAVVRRRIQVAEFAKQFEVELARVVAWTAATDQRCEDRLRRRGWLSHEFKADVIRERPAGLQKLLAEPEIEALFRGKDRAIQDAVAKWQAPFPAAADALNQRHLAHELQASKAFFDTVEKSPLTAEQARAVLCFDSRVLLVASAGSGKTSTMVAKAGFALKKGYFAPERILLLAFNNDAAAELRERIEARLGPLGLPAERVTAKTFHAFGLDVIGAATGRKPSVASWVDSGDEIAALSSMVDELKDYDFSFRTQWDLFRLVFGQDLPKFGGEEASPEAWDREAKREGFRTLNNEVVRSRGELFIANWLFYNGVRYEYEADYRFDTATAQYRQYKPDFYLPDADAYLEHWALDANGEPPPEFVDYKIKMAWKRQLHADNKTRLLETTMAELWTGQAFEYLERELTALGIKLDPNPDRDVPGLQPIDNPRLLATVRQFLTHVKGSRLTVDMLRGRLRQGIAGLFRFRHEMFLNVFEKLWARWEAKLRAEKAIDFDDMLNQAADFIEQGRWESPFELVMVDEFQDASQARARMLAGLMSKPDRHLFAVGDDWQSINRFAGADLSVMTEFEAKFGKAVTLKLETTFRCPQSLCDISSSFVQRNPRQLRKAVRSTRIDVTEPIRIVSVEDERETRAAVEATLVRIMSAAVGSKKPTAFLLGRYRRDQAYFPTFDPARVEVEFITVHSSKGREADYVIVPRVTSERLGFPSQMVDDPVLQLAMPVGEGHEFAEERRLFYVALTRARQRVTLITVGRKESAFVSELVREHGIKIVDSRGEPTSTEQCPVCRTGFLVPRKGKFGPFHGCSEYPACKHTRKVV